MSQEKRFVFESGLFIGGMAAVFCLLFLKTTPLERPESAYERVARTMTLQCGYIVSPPFVEVAPNTGQLTGMDVLYAERMASLLGLSIVWHEIVMGNQVQDLRSGKVDAVCAGEGPLIASMTMYLRYSRPKAWFPIHMYVRAQDHRFDGLRDDVLKKANLSTIKIAMMDGDVSADFAHRLFPRAGKDSLPQTASMGQLYMEVVSGKADFVIDDPFTAGAFQAQHPGDLRQVQLDRPFAVIPAQLSVLRGEEALGNLFDDGILLMQARGLADLVLSRYEKAYPQSIWRDFKPF